MEQEGYKVDHDEKEERADSSYENAPFHSRITKLFIHWLWISKSKHHLVELIGFEEIERTGFENGIFDCSGISWLQCVKENAKHDDLQWVDHSPQVLEGSGQKNRDDQVASHNSVNCRFKCVFKFPLNLRWHIWSISQLGKNHLYISNLYNRFALVVCK